MLQILTTIEFMVLAILALFKFVMLFEQLLIPWFRRMLKK